MLIFRDMQVDWNILNFQLIEFQMFRCWVYTGCVTIIEYVSKFTANVTWVLYLPFGFGTKTSFFAVEGQI